MQLSFGKESRKSVSKMLSSLSLSFLSHQDYATCMQTGHVIVVSDWTTLFMDSFFSLSSPHPSTCLGMPGPICEQKATAKWREGTDKLKTEEKCVYESFVSMEKRNQNNTVPKNVCQGLQGIMNIMKDGEYGCSSPSQRLL